MAKLCPSLMCVDFSNLKEELHKLETAGADMFHLDIMDGTFVPNFALGFEDVKAISKLANIPYDVHLMVMNPAPYIEKLADLGCDIIYIHIESSIQIHRNLLQIQATGKKVGLAINPGTPLCMLENIMDLIDVILIMTVNPGFAGQKFIDQSIEHIKNLHHLIVDKKLSTKIAIDGAITPHVVKQTARYVEYFILGTAGLFLKDKTYKQAIAILRDQLH